MHNEAMRLRFQPQWEGRELGLVVCEYREWAFTDANYPKTVEPSNNTSHLSGFEIREGEPEPGDAQLSVSRLH